MIRIAARLLALATATAAPIAAQQDQQLELGAGPVVCFTQNAGGTPRMSHLLVANCDGDRKAQRFCKVQGNVRIAARLDRSHFLLSCYDKPYGLVVADAHTGATHLLAEGSPHDFVGLHGDQVLYLGDNRYDKGDNYLYARPWRGGEARRLAEVRLDSVPLRHGNLAFAVTAGEREVWKISLTRGTGSRVHTLPEHCMGTRLALSPSGQRLAIGCAAQGRGHLAVIDLGSNRAVQSWQNLNIDVSPLSSSMPTLEVTFADDEHVLTSETIGDGLRGGHFATVRRSLDSGKVVEEIPAGDLGLYHHKPQVPGAPAETRFFDVRTKGERYLLVRPDRDAPVTDVPNVRGRACDLILSPGGRYAIERLERSPNLMVLHRRDRAPLALFDQYCTDLVWFDAAR